MFSKNLFFIILILSFIFPISGMDDPFASPPRTQQAAGVVAAPVLPELTEPEINQLSKLLGMCIGQIQNVHRLFAGEFVEPTTDVLGIEGKAVGEDTKPRIATAEIRFIFLSLLDSIFLPRFTPKGKHYTPACRKSLEGHCRAISGNSPRTFVKKDDTHFASSVRAEDFPVVIETHFGNKFYIPKWMLLPESGFALWRKATKTLFEGIKTGPCNVVKMLNGENPESLSGPMEHHHVFQNQGTVTPVCFGIHKRESKTLHKAAGETLIDRSICGTEFYFANKIIALLQMAHMCTKLLEDVDVGKLQGDVATQIAYILRYSGNVDVIPSSAQKAPRLSGIAHVFGLGDRAAPSPINLVYDSEPDDEEDDVDADAPVVPASHGPLFPPPQLAEDDDSSDDEEGSLSQKKRARRSSTENLRLKRGKLESTEERKPLSSLQVNQAVA